MAQTTFNNGDTHGTARTAINANATDAESRLAAQEAFDVGGSQTQMFNYMNTGILTGGIVTINGGDNTKIDISAGTGVVVNNTDPLNPVFTPVTWTAFTAEALPDVVGDFFTGVAIDSAGTGLVFAPEAEFTHTQRLANIILVNAVHPVATITSIASRQVKAVNVLEQFYEFARAVGSVNVDEGSRISANGANLSLDRSAGCQYIVSSNYQTNPQEPNVIESILETAITFGHAYQNGSGGTTFTGVLTAFVDPTQWDDGTGTLASVTNNNTWTLQPVWFFPSSGNHIMEYGQAEYASLAAAIADIPPNTFNHSAILRNGGMLLAWLALKKNTTDVSNATENAILPAYRFNP